MYVMCVSVLCIYTCVCVCSLNKHRNLSKQFSAHRKLPPHIRLGPVHSPRVMARGEVGYVTAICAASLWKRMRGTVSRHTGLSALLLPAWGLGLPTAGRGHHGGVDTECRYVPYPRSTLTAL